MFKTKLSDLEKEYEKSGYLKPVGKVVVIRNSEEAYNRLFSNKEVYEHLYKIHKKYCEVFLMVNGTCEQVNEYFKNRFENLIFEDYGVIVKRKIKEKTNDGQFIMQTTINFNIIIDRSSKGILCLMPPETKWLQIDSKVYLGKKLSSEDIFYESAKLVEPEEMLFGSNKVNVGG